MTNFKDLVLEKSISVKDAKHQSKEIEVGKVDSKAKKLYNDIIDTINSSKYNKAVDFVDNISADSKLKFILSLGFGGVFADLDLKIQEKDINVKDLIPMQNEIGTEETFKFILSGKNIESCFSTPAVIKKPIVTLNSKYIIDGHHRWSEIYITNIDAKAHCINIQGNLSPINALKAIQCTIGSNLGHLIKTEKKGKNLLDMSKNEIYSYVKNLSKDAENKFKLFGVYNPINYIVNNCLEMQKNNRPINSAPPRNTMPQTSKDPDLFDDLENGVQKPK